MNLLCPQTPHALRADAERFSRRAEKKRKIDAFWATPSPNSRGTLGLSMGSKMASVIPCCDDLWVGAN